MVTIFVLIDSDILFIFVTVPLIRPIIQNIVGEPSYFVPAHYSPRVFPVIHKLEEPTN